MVEIQMRCGPLHNKTFVTARFHDFNRLTLLRDGRTSFRLELRFEAPGGWEIDYKQSEIYHRYKSKKHEGGYGYKFASSCRAYVIADYNVLCMAINNRYSWARYIAMWEDLLRRNEEVLRDVSLGVTHHLRYLESTRLVKKLCMAGRALRKYKIFMESYDEVWMNSIVPQMSRPIQSGFKKKFKLV